MRLLSFVLLLAMLAASVVGLASCNTNDPTTPANKPTAPDAGKEIPAGLAALAHNGKTQYQIVYPRSGGDVIQSTAEELAMLITENTGVEIPVVHDFDAETDFEIRVGKVQRMNAMTVYSSYNKFSDRDFAVEMVGNILYIYGSTPQAVTSAMRYFTEKVLYLKNGTAGVEKTFSLKYVETGVESVKYTGADENYAYISVNPGDFSEAFLRLSFTPNNGWRIQSKTNASEPFNDFGASQRMAYSMGEEMPLTVYPITATEENGKLTLREAGGSHVVVNLAKFEMSFYNSKGDCSATITNITANYGGSSIEGKINPNEGIYGTGERFNQANQRGQKIHMFTKDIWSQANACYMVIPMLCFTRGSGIFLNTYEEMNLELGSKGKISQEDVWSASIMGAPIDVYVFVTEKMSDAIKGYTDLSGHATAPAEWTYGMIICRYSPDLSQKWTTSITPGDKSDGRGMGVYDTIAYMEAYDLPWTAILAEGWSPYKTTKHRDLEELCDYVHSLGKKFLVYMRVGWAGSDQSGFLNDYLVSMTYPNGMVTTKLPAAESNNPDTAGSTKEYPYLDVSNPAACDWFFGEYWDYLSNDLGVDGCKIDFCETLPEYYELNYYDEKLPTSGSHHWYPSAFCAKFFDMIASKPDSGMCYTRGGGIGAQRAPYMWAGDQARVWDAIAWQMTAVLSSGMSGVPFMSYDMSGYQYGGHPNSTISLGGNSYTMKDPKYEAKVFVRGLQFTAFTICMQQHGKVRQAFEFAEGDIHMEDIYRDGSAKKYTLTMGGNEFKWWCKTTTGGLDEKTGYYKGINPETGNLYGWEYNEDGTVKMAAVYSFQDKDGKTVYTLSPNRTDRDGKVIEEYTYVRTLKKSDGSLDSATGYFKGVVLNKDKDGKIIGATDKLESDGIKYVYEIQPGEMSYVTDIYRAYIKLHELLTPYITELSKEAAETGMPVARVLALQWQNDVNTYKIEDQYMFGDAFMIAPMLTDSAARDIYLPEGNWVDLMSGEKYEVGAEGMWLRDYKVGLQDMPVFFNEGTTSEVAEGLLPGIQEIFDYLDTIYVPAN